MQGQCPPKGRLFAIPLQAPTIITELPHVPRVVLIRGRFGRARDVVEAQRMWVGAALRLRMEGCRIPPLDEVKGSAAG